MSDSYLTIEREVRAEFKDKGSKFIAYLFPLTKEAELAERISGLKSANIKAGHFCPAFRLRDGHFRSSDDGEPSGSAGKPILNQLISAELVDVACVVVRYWGGTKLGVSGLITAYKTATKLAIEESSIITKYETVNLILDFDYAIMGTLMNALKQLKMNVVEKNLTAMPNIIIEVNKSELELAITSIKAKMLGRSLEDITEETEISGLKFSSSSSEKN